MIGRLSLAEIKARLVAELAPGPTIATALERNYLTEYARTFPAVWVCAQRAVARTGVEEDGSAGWYEQQLAVEFVVRVVVQRYADGVVDNSGALDALINDAHGALCGWTPSNASRPVTLSSAQDGPPHESIMSADLVFRTEITMESA